MNLDEEYSKLLEYQPVEEEREFPTIFDISGYPHFENVISNWYAFFLRTDNEHGFNDLFYKSLRMLLKQAPSGPYCEVEREYATSSGRIDLLVHEGFDDIEERLSNPLIIENKIYAEIYNDLNDYWSSVAHTGEQGKSGLVLCLHITDQDRAKIEKVNKPIMDGSFEIHTHQEYMDIVRQNLPDCFIKSNFKYLNILQDFMANIERMTKMSIMSDNSKYYFENHEKIDVLMSIRKEANRTIINNAYELIQKRDDLKWGRSKAIDGTFDVTIGDSGGTCYVTISGLYYEISLWMSKSLRDLWNNINEPNKEKVLARLGESKGKKEKCDNKEMLAKIRYEVSKDEIDSYHEKIIDTMSNDWVKILEAINNSNV